MFSEATFRFLDELTAHNDRAWFEAHKARYEAEVREPALAFITAMDPLLGRFAPRFRAEPRKVGGSLMRIHRDTRFSRDKTPYKTNVGIQFRHDLGKDVHAPGFYLHVAGDGCFLGAGCWHPEPDDLAKIRNLVAARPEHWFAARDDRKFAKDWALWGDGLSGPPRGYAADHPAIEDLKRKDFVALANLSYDEVISPGLPKLAAKRYAAAVPLMKFLCEALGASF
ncbi:MAG: DUF2461 domain-containing protein [Rhodocyclaceae bacterium]|nr:DUF2461 domain-containing protein [Rhodocyclaceae bacterium]